MKYKVSISQNRFCIVYIDFEKKNTLREFYFDCRKKQKEQPESIIEKFIAFFFLTKHFIVVYVKIFSSTYIVLKYVFDKSYLTLIFNVKCVKTF